MPTSTFYRLPPEKQEKILRAAVAEFSRKSCGEASINRIIQAAEIPRGSFYQYFADKRDLFRYVLRHYGRGMEEWIQECLEEQNGQLLELPLALFDRAADRARDGGRGLRELLPILRQNAGLDVGQMWDFPRMAQRAIELADLRSLAVDSREELLALVDLLISSTGQAVVAVYCGKLTEQESRRRLTHKVALLRRGVEKQEEPQC